MSGFIYGIHFIYLSTFFFSLDDETNNDEGENGDSEYILVTSRVAVKAHFQSPNVDISNSATSMLEENIALLQEISANA